MIETFDNKIQIYKKINSSNQKEKQSKYKVKLNKKLLKLQEELKE